MVRKIIYLKMFVAQGDRNFWKKKHICRIEIKNSSWNEERHSSFIFCLLRIELFDVYLMKKSWLFHDDLKELTEILSLEEKRNVQWQKTKRIQLLGMKSFNWWFCSYDRRSRRVNIELRSYLSFKKQRFIQILIDYWMKITSDGSAVELFMTVVLFVSRTVWNCACFFNNCANWRFTWLCVCKLTTFLE